MHKSHVSHILLSLGLALSSVALLIGALSLPLHAARAASLPPEALNRPEPQGLQASGTYSISNITGATYDPARGEIVIFGVADPSLPPMDFAYLRENLVIALRAFYDPANLDDLGVSIEGTLDPLHVIYFGGIDNTHMGRVAFETDRLLKTYTLGRDNLTGAAVTSTVPGYLSYPDRMKQLTEPVSDPIVIRYFYTPTLVVEEIPTPHTLVFSQTQKFIDWGYLSGVTSTATATAAQGFVDNFNQHYWDYATERLAAYGDPTLYEIVQLSKLTAIARWAYDQGLEVSLPGLNAPWLVHFPVSYFAAITQTPGITVTWVQTISDIAYSTNYLRGGTYLSGNVTETPPDSEGQATANEVHDELKQLEPPPMVHLMPPHPICPMDTVSEADECDPFMADVFPLATNAVDDGGFENGSVAWVQDSLGGDLILPHLPLQGSYSAWLGGYDSAQDSLTQRIYIPADATHARLTYWRTTSTDETTHPHDYFASFLTSASLAPLGSLPANLETIDDGTADSYWHQVSFDVSAYAGQTVQLWFTATTDAANVTSFYVDDVSLDYLDLVPPAVVAATHSPAQLPLGSTVELALTFREHMKTTVPPTVTVHSLGSSAVYTATPKSGAGYTSGYMDSDPTKWYGTLALAAPMPDGSYGVDVSNAQDVAGNVMYPAASVDTFVLDAISPQAQSTYPASGASGVATDANIVITFSEAISSSTFAYTVSPDPGGWAATWNGPQTAVRLTHAAFTGGTPYQVSVTQARDLAGNPLSGAPVAWAFATAGVDATPPAVMSQFPANGASHVLPGASVVITFSEPINTGSLAYAVLPDPGGWAANWNGPQTVVTLSHADFAPGTSYQVSVTQARDLTSNPLSSAPVAWTFATGYKTYLPLAIK